MLAPVEKELVAIGISVATGCASCLAFHLRAAREAGARLADVEDVVAEAVAVREQATRVAEAAGMERPPPAPATNGSPTWIRALAGIAAAYAVTCPTTLEHRLNAGRHVGVGPDDVRSVARLADFIRDKATSYVVDLVRG